MWRQNREDQKEAKRDRRADNTGLKAQLKGEDEQLRQNSEIQEDEASPRGVGPPWWRNGNRPVEPRLPIAERTQIKS